MDSFMMSNGIAVRVRIEGKGDTIVLLHGYLETLEVWEPFAAELAKHYQVVTIDLPGHGLSGWSGGVHTMEYMADTLKQLLDKQGITNCMLVGHSMGGYVSLAFAKKYGAMLNGLCLFHSSPNPDTEDKKANRDREIELIRADKLGLVVKQAIPRTFAEENVKRFQEVIWDIEESAEIADKEGIIACLQGMKEREDMNAFLAGFGKPLLFIFGRGDNIISSALAEELTARFPQAQSIMLEKSGHMGFLEEPEVSLNTLILFTSKIF